MLLLMTTGAFATCGDPADHLDDAELHLAESRYELAGDAVAAADSAIECGATVDTETLARLWLVDGAVALAEGDSARAALALTAAHRTAPELWLSVLGDDVRAVRDAAIAEETLQGTLDLSPRPATARVDTVDTVLPAELPVGLHLVQLGPDGAYVEFVELPPSDLVLEHGLVADRAGTVAQVLLVDGGVEVETDVGVYPAVVGFQLARPDVLVVPEVSWAVLELHNAYVVRLEEDLVVPVADLQLLDAPPSPVSAEDQLAQLLDPSEREAYGGILRDERVVGWHARASAGSSAPPLVAPDGAFEDVAVARSRRPRGLGISAGVSALASVGLGIWAGVEGASRDAVDTFDLSDFDDIQTYEEALARQEEDEARHRRKVRALGIGAAGVGAVSLGLGLGAVLTTTF